MQEYCLVIASDGPAESQREILKDSQRDLKTKWNGVI